MPHGLEKNARRDMVPARRTMAGKSDRSIMTASESDPDATVDFDTLSDSELRAMRRAGEIVVDCHRVLAKTGDNIVGEILKDHGTFYEWDHYPPGDVYDFETHGQYYYHAHPPEERPGEHGHFHTFLRPKGMPPDVRPAPVPDFAMPEDEDDALSHLAAISMDARGFPIKLFTTNRWVTGEIWYSADDVCRMLERFEIDLAHPSWPVNLWITNMIVLFRPQIRLLLRRRDEVVEAWQRDHPESNVYEDRNLEVTSEVAISIDDQIRAIEDALARRDV